MMASNQLPFGKPPKPMMPSAPDYITITIQQLSDIRNPKHNPQSLATKYRTDIDTINLIRQSCRTA